MEQIRSKMAINIQKVFKKNNGMKQKDNNLAHFEKNSFLSTRLEAFSERSPSLYRGMLMVVAGVSKPIMAARAKFHDVTGGFFSQFNIPWFKIIVIAAATYVLMYKNLNFNVKLNTPPPTTVTEQTSMNFVKQTVPLAPLLAEDDRLNRLYIERFRVVAVTEMKRFNIPASVKMAQAILESKAGQSLPAKKLRNHFNLPCGVLQAGNCTETTDGIYKKFDSPWESWRVHSEYLAQGKFAELFSIGNDYRAWATRLQELGYSNDEQYAQKIVQLIEAYDLAVLDREWGN
jgi:hypothetical protein